MYVCSILQWRVSDEGSATDSQIHTHIHLCIGGAPQVVHALRDCLQREKRTVAQEGENDERAGRRGKRVPSVLFTLCCL